MKLRSKCNYRNGEKREYSPLSDKVVDEPGEETMKNRKSINALHHVHWASLKITSLFHCYRLLENMQCCSVDLVFHRSDYGFEFSLISSFLIAL